METRYNIIIIVFIATIICKDRFTDEWSEHNFVFFYHSLTLEHILVNEWK